MPDDNTLEGFVPMLGAPPAPSADTVWVVPESSMYESYITNVEPVPNPFYDGKENNNKFQLLWTIQLDESDLPPLTQDDPDGKVKKYSSKGRWYTGTALGRHPKNKLVAMCKKADPTFDLEVGYVDLNDMKAKTIGSYVRSITSINTVVKEGKTNSYLKIDSLLASSKGKVPMATLLALQTGGITTTADKYEDDIPF